MTFALCQGSHVNTVRDPIYAPLNSPSRHTLSLLPVHAKLVMLIKKLVDTVVHQHALCLARHYASYGSFAYHERTPPLSSDRYTSQFTNDTMLQLPRVTDLGSQISNVANRHRLCCDKSIDIDQLNLPRRDVLTGVESIFIQRSARRNCFSIRVLLCWNCLQAPTEESVSLHEFKCKADGI